MVKIVRQKYWQVAGSPVRMSPNLSRSWSIQYGKEDEEWLSSFRTTRDIARMEGLRRIGLVGEKGKIGNWELTSFGLLALSRFFLDLPFHSSSNGAI